MSDLRERLARKPILLAPGVFDALGAALAEAAGFEALYLSGASLAYTRLGLPDLGFLGANELAEAVARIRERVERPLIVDADTGFGNALNVQRTVRLLEGAGAAAIQIEDQASPKRCGHLRGKVLISKAEMVGKIHAALDARRDARTLLVARTDAIAVEGLDAAIERARACVEAGADGVFAEAATDLDTYRRFAAAVDAPLLANITEFGATPLFTVDELASANVAMALYPLSAFRAMNKAAQTVYQAIRRDGTQKAVLPMMQTRAELYESIGYHDYERRLDALFARRGESGEP